MAAGGDEPIDEDAIAPREISDQDFNDCNAVGDNLDVLILNVTNDDLDRQIAVDLLAGEFCNRPQLVHEINPMHEPSIALVAYACDSASGKVGDATLQDSLVDFEETYCASAKKVVTDQIDTIQKFVETYKSDVPASASDEESKLKLEEISTLVNDANGLVDSEKYYEAMKALDSSSAIIDELRIG